MFNFSLSCWIYNRIVLSGDEGSGHSAESDLGQCGVASRCHKERLELRSG